MEIKFDKDVRINSEEYWDLIFEDEVKRNSFRPNDDRWQLLLPYIPPTARLCDYGCGRGEFLKWLRDKLPHAFLVGIDFSSFAISDCKKNIEGVEFICAPEIVGGNYDVITIQHVLEHFPRPEEKLEEAYNHLKVDGLCVVVFPMYDNEWIEHYRIWTLESLRQWLKEQWRWQWLLLYRPETRWSGKMGSVEEAVVFMKKKQYI